MSSIALSRARGVLIARQIHEARIETAERLAAAEELHARPLLQGEDAVRNGLQLIDRGLKQLVARQRIEDVQQRFAAMALRLEPRVFHELPNLEPHERNHSRATAVGGRGKQPDKTPLQHGLARPIENFDADVIQ